jgi:hypothetical protein
MAGSMKKGDLPPDPRVVIPKLEDYIDVSSLTSDPAAPPVIASTGVGDCTCAGIAHFLAAVTAYSGDVPGGVMFSESRNMQG